MSRLRTTHSADTKPIVEIAPKATREELKRDTGGLVPITLQGQAGTFGVYSLPLTGSIFAGCFLV